MDSDRAPMPQSEPETAPEAAPARAPKAKKVVPKWTDAIPDDLDFSDSLGLAAKLGPAAVAIALVQILSAVGIKPMQRAAMVAQLAGQLPGLIDKRRLWEAERAIRGEIETMEEPKTGPTTELRPHAATTPTDPATSRAKAIRGRPRKRSIL